MNILKINFEKQDFQSLNKVPGNFWIAGFWSKYPSASGGLERPPDPLTRVAQLAMRVDEPPLEIPAYGPVHCQHFYHPLTYMQCHHFDHKQPTFRSYTVSILIILCECYDITVTACRSVLLPQFKEQASGNQTR